ncbi:hypothetical protein, partial [Salmonella sp. s54836]|uniref:hypothetical protein n=1 Tax=Salmonella sp. s54836 TaxID=3159673 RepID=UPI00397F1D5D
LKFVQEVEFEILSIEMILQSGSVVKNLLDTVWNSSLSFARLFLKTPGGKVSCNNSDRRDVSI